MKKNILMAGLALALAVPAFAQSGDEPKLKISPTGRILLDGALYAGQTHDLFDPGVAITDARVGVKASYGKWNACIDVGYAYGKVGLKDIYLQYNFDEENLLCGGHFIHQYGLQSATSSSMKCTMEEPTSNEVFNAPRQLGIMYVHSTDKWLATASAHVEPQSTFLHANKMQKQGYGVLSRVIARPVHEDGNTVQLGISGGFGTPQYSDDNEENHHVFELGGNFPTRVDQVKAVDATVDHAMNMFKFTPELLLSYQKVALEAQYFFNRYNRRQHIHAFTGQGGYVTLRGLLIGDRYGYAMVDGGLATPSAKSLELVLSYNYTTLTDEHAGIWGGRVNDVSATLNYYINKYMLFRFRYAYTHRWDCDFAPKVDLSAFQARLQIIF